MGTKRDFIREELLVDKFMEDETNICHLEETEDSGRSVLEFELNSDTNISIKNVDKKHTDMYFFQNSKAKSMFKRVDHIIFEHRPGDKWRVQKEHVQLIPLYDQKDQPITRKVWMMFSEKCYRSQNIMDFISLVEEYYHVNRIENHRETE